MVSHCVHTLCLQFLSQRDSILPTNGIDNARIFGITPDDGKNLFESVSLAGIEFVGQVRSVHRPDHEFRISHSKTIPNIVDYPWSGSGRTSEKRYFRRSFPQFAQGEVIRTKIMPPLTYAMSLVDYDHTNFQSRDQFFESFAAHPLRSNVQHGKFSPA